MAQAASDTALPEGLRPLTPVLAGTLPGRS